jgi:arylsulfatase A-like enzyme
MVVRWGRWKYVEYRGGFLKSGEVELYDLDADPDELTSVHADPSNAAVRSLLAARLRELVPSWTQPIP